MKLVSTFQIRQTDLEKLSAFRYQTKVLPSEQALIESDDMVDADVIMANHRTLQVDFLERCKHVRWVQCPHAGIERLDMAYLERRNIIVVNARGGFGVPIAEDILCKMLMLSRNSATYVLNQQNHVWKSEPGTVNLSRKTVGIIGAGDVGSHAAIRAKAFGMTTIGMNTSGEDVPGFDRMYTQEQVNEMIPQCDYIVLSCPLTERTHQILDTPQFKLMKPTAFIINISRGALMNEAVLFDCLQNRKIAGAALDVFTEEFKYGKLPEDSPFWSLDNVIITPHQAGGGDQFYDRFMEVFLENAEHFAAGELDDMRNIRAYDKGY